MPVDELVGIQVPMIATPAMPESESSPATNAVYNWYMLAADKQSPTITMHPAGSTGAMRLIVLGGLSMAQTMRNQAVGDVFLNTGGTLGRHLPQYDWSDANPADSPNHQGFIRWCTQATITPYAGDGQQVEDFSLDPERPLCQFSHWALDLRFESVPYVLKLAQDITASEGKPRESQRFTEKHHNPGGQYLDIDRSELEYTDSGEPAGTALPFWEYTEEVIIKWWDVPRVFYNQAVITELAGKTNLYTFYDEFEPETLIFLNCIREPKLAPDGTPLYTISYRFAYKPTGVNKVRRNSGEFDYAAIKYKNQAPEVDEGRIFVRKDFARLFTMDVAGQV